MCLPVWAMYKALVQRHAYSTWTMNSRNMQSCHIQQAVMVSYHINGVALATWSIKSKLSNTTDPIHAKAQYDQSSILHIEQLKQQLRQASLYSKLGYSASNLLKEGSETYRANQQSAIQSPILNQVFLKCCCIITCTMNKSKPGS